MNRRLLFGLVTGSLLGIICILGASIRSSFTEPWHYLLSFWYNRVIMGAFIGLLPRISLKKAVLRGAVLGALISFAFYSATGFNDFIGFMAGIAYGMIIETVLFKKA